MRVEHSSSSSSSKEQPTVTSYKAIRPGGALQYWLRFAPEKTEDSDALDSLRPSLSNFAHSGHLQASPGTYLRIEEWVG